MKLSSKADIRKTFSGKLSQMFAKEVPEYEQFTNIVIASNEAFLKANPKAVVDSEDRVLAEKHGAIRVGTKEEMRTVTRIFAVMGMYPVEFYDMTQLPKGALPMIATAFRPIDESIETSAFRMFCSMLHPNHITEDIAEPVVKELAKRKENNPKFSPKLMELLVIAEKKGGLTQKEADEFVDEVVNAFRINKEKPIHFDLYKQLRQKNDVFADIVCLGININHLTPRAYDIEDAQQRLKDAGIPIKDGGIEGPPIRKDAPAIQLNQTSRKAPGEPLFVSNDPEVLAMDVHSPKWQELKKNAPMLSLNPDESVQDYLARIEEALKSNKLLVIQHKARFGEIESRGVALTQKGEELYKKLLSEKQFTKQFPKTHEEMFMNELAYYTFEVTEKGKNAKTNNEPIKTQQLKELVQEGYVRVIPQTYNDFLAASAAGIFKSNMSTGVKGIDTSVQTKSAQNKQLLENAMVRPIISRHELHASVAAESVKNVYQTLGISMPSMLRTSCDRALNNNPVQKENGSGKM